MFNQSNYKYKIKCLTWITLIIAQCLPAHALSNPDLSELGFEIFIDDPAEAAKKEETAMQNKVDSLPDFIDLQVWKEDLELDAPQVEPPKEPSWEGLYKQADITDIGAESCCLRAARASRYQAEAACLAMNKKVWELRSIIPEEQTQPDAKLGNCLVYNQEKMQPTQDDSSSTNSSPDEPGSFELDPFRCIAKAMAKCYTLEQPK